MRLVKEDKNFLSELQEAKSESLSVFGDDNIILEKFFEQARHIEVQIFADNLAISFMPLRGNALFSVGTKN